MKKQNEETIYVYKRGNTRHAYLSPLSPFEMVINKMEIADVIQVERGLEWFTEVNEHAEALLMLMNRQDRNEAIEWAQYLFQSMEEKEDK